MTDHCDEELIALLSGELDRETTTQVVSHLRECGECTAALISVAVAYGTLRAARRAEDALIPRTSVATAVPEPVEQPPLGRRPVKKTHRLSLVAAAAVLVLGALGAALALRGTSSPPVYALATLHHMDAPATASGRVTVRSTNQVKFMDVVTIDLPAAPANHYYEVWLLQPATNKMLPVGLLPPSGEGTYSVAGGIMSQYSAVDISLQTNDGNPAHSKYSVLRGTVTPILS